MSDDRYGSMGRVSEDGTRAEIYVLRNVVKSDARARAPSVTGSE